MGDETRAVEGRQNRERPAATDRLGFGRYVGQLDVTIREATDRGHLPMTIGVYGPWGSGKTSLMKMVEQKLVPPAEVARRTRRKEWRRGVAPRFYAWLALAFVAVVLGFVFARGPTRLVAELARVDLRTGLWLWCTMLFGALGGIFRSGFEVWRHSTVEHDGDSPATWLVLVRPLLGLVIGIVPYLVLAAPWKTAGSAVIPVWIAPVIYVAAWALGASFDWIARASIRLARRRRQRAPRPAAAQDHYQVIWFQAWRYTREKELWAALLQRLLTELEVNAYGWARLRIRWKLWVRSVTWNSGALDVMWKLLPTVGKAAVTALLAAGGWIAVQQISGAGIPLAAAASTGGGLLGILTWARQNVVTPLVGLNLDKYRRKASHTQYLTFLAQFSDELTRIAKIARGAGNPIVVMLDDLDRCLPDQAVSVLESMKLFVGDDAPIVFVMGVDRDFIERAIEVKYDKVMKKGEVRGFGREYLEKIVQLPFNLPPISPANMAQFIRDSYEDEHVRRLAHVFAAGMPSNPRQMIRVVDTFRFSFGIADRHGDVALGLIDPSVLAKLIIVQYRWPELYGELVGEPALLERLEQVLAGKLDRTPRDEAILRANPGLAPLLLVEDAASLVGVSLLPYVYVAARAQEPSAGPARPPGSTEEIAAARAEIAALDEEIARLSDEGGDAPLIASLSGKRRDVDELISRGDVATARAILGDLRRLAAEGRPVEEPARRLPTKGRATSYARLRVRVEASGSRRLRFLVEGSFGTRIHDAETGDLELLARLFRGGEGSTGRYLEMGRGLGEALERALGPGALSGPTRIEIVAEDPRVDGLPWEMALIRDLPIALRPTDSVVRVIPTARAMAAPQPLRAVVRQIHEDDELLAQSDAAMELLRASGIQVSDVRQVGDVFDASSLRAAAGGNPFSEVVHVFSDAPRPEELETLERATLAILDAPLGARLAPLLRGGPPAVLAWQFPTKAPTRAEFYLGFYETLVRTGQVDLAVTEGRRRMAAKIVAPPIGALSPVLYLDPATDGVLFRP